MTFSRRMRPLPAHKLRIDDPFWNERMRIVAAVSLPAQFDKLESEDRLGNLRRCAAGKTGTHTGWYFNDSDVYKWIEAASYSLAAHSNDLLKNLLDRAVDVVLSAQRPDGYLNSFIQLNHPGMEFRNLGALHELYCAGHLIEAGVAHFQFTGERRLLDGAIRFAELIDREFGPTGRAGYCGHEELELALIKLAECVGAPKFRELARRMVDLRGIRPTPIQLELNDEQAQAMAPGHAKMLSSGDLYVGEYCQDHRPVREHDKVVGHAVRAMYLYAAAANLATDVPDDQMEKALEACWTNLTGRRMYVTGGIGPSRSNEGFTSDYDLPNLSAYAETCASCGLIFWAQAMLEATGSSEYAELIERTLYNGLLAGISLDGLHYFYDNPLESRGAHERSTWFPCACCPPNVARVIANLREYTLGIGESEIFINQLVGCRAEVDFEGVQVQIRVESKLPWKGEFTVHVDPSEPAEFAVNVRMPDWALDVSTDVPGDDEAEYLDGYAVFRRTWRPGDQLKIEFELATTFVEASPKVADDIGRLALVRGPLVYCAESIDNNFPPQRFTVDFEAEHEEQWVESLGGLVEVKVPGFLLMDDGSDELYSPFGTAEEQDGFITMIPYFAWANRGPSHMLVWLMA